MKDLSFNIQLYGILEGRERNNDVKGNSFRSNECISCSAPPYLLEMGVISHIITKTWDSMRWVSDIVIYYLWAPYS